MEIKNIKTFIRVAELGNFTKAAHELGYAQSTITAQIQQLEADLKLELFERNGKKVCLSVAGKEFLEYAYQIIKYETMIVEHFSQSGEPKGSLNIGIMESLIASEYAEVFWEFQKKHPQIYLNLQIVTTHQALRYLDEGKFDLIFLLDNKISRQNMVIAEEHPVDIPFFCAASHPLAKHPSVSLSRLLEEPFILTESGCSYRQAFEGLLARDGRSLNRITEIGYSPYIIESVIRRLGISLLPSITLAGALAQESISLIHLPECHISMFIQVIYSSRRYVSMPMRAFMEHFKEWSHEKKPV